MWKRYHLALLLMAYLGSPAVAQVVNSEFCAPEMNDTQLLACAQSAPPDSAKAALAYANLGTRAYARDDFETAAWYYLRSMPGRSIVDIILHTDRADVLSMMDGGDDLAISDALIALRMAREGKDRDGPITPEKKWTVIPRLVRILDRSDDKGPRDEAAAMLLGLPASSAEDFGDRAIVFGVTGRLEESLTAINRAIALAPNVPMLKNNKCTSLMRLERNAEAVEVCQVAYTADPTNLTIMESMADAYAKTARCKEAGQVISTAKALFPNESYLDEFVCPYRPVNK